MTHTRLTQPALFGLLLLALLNTPQPGASHPLDQSATRSPTPQPPATPLSFGRTVTGTASRAGEAHNFSFTVPEDHDVVVAFTATKAFYVSYCITHDQAGGCAHEGGGGGSDVPTTENYIIPSTTPGNVVLSVRRALDGPARFSLTVYSVTPLSMTLGAPLLVKPDAQVPFQVLMLDADPTKPLVVQAQDTAGGNYLWVNSQPSTFNNGSIGSSDWLPFAADIDAAQLDGTRSLSFMSLAYLGKTSFTVLVNSPTDYLISATPLEPAPLVRDTPVTVMLSDQQPVWVGLFNVKAGEKFTVHTSLTSGAGLSRSVYAEDYNLTEQNLFSLSSTAQTDVPLIVTARQDGGVTVVLTIPVAFSRGTVTAQISWSDD